MREIKRVGRGCGRKEGQRIKKGREVRRNGRRECGRYGREEMEAGREGWEGGISRC